jgi:DnaJ-class molecular chaperone
VSVAEAILGGAVDVPTPGGAVTMRIPPHSANGAELRLRGRGVPAHGGRAKGDLYAKLALVLGPPDAALDEFLRDWAPKHPFDPRQEMRSGT